MRVHLNNAELFAVVVVVAADNSNYNIFSLPPTQALIMLLFSVENKS